MCYAVAAELRKEKSARLQGHLNGVPPPTGLAAPPAIKPVVPVADAKVTSAPSSATAAPCSPPTILGLQTLQKSAGLEFPQLQKQRRGMDGLRVVVWESCLRMVVGQDISRPGFEDVSCDAVAAVRTRRREVSDATPAEVAHPTAERAVAVARSRRCSRQAVRHARAHAVTRQVRRTSAGYLLHASIYLGSKVNTMVALQTNLGMPIRSPSSSHTLLQVPFPAGGIVAASVQYSEHKFMTQGAAARGGSEAAGDRGATQV